MRKLKIGTRGSLLALTQANIVRDQILAHHSNYSVDDINIEVITTSGDRIQDRSLAEIGGKGLFTKEIEEALLQKKIDLAVHSMKDLPAIITNSLDISCFLEREDPRDAFISINNNIFDSIENLPINAIVGTSSARRKSQLLQIRNDLNIVPFRGNVTTRIEKLASHQVDATLLAMAGLNRLNIDAHLYHPIDVDLILPAVAQGIVGIQINELDDYVRELIAPLNHETTSIAVSAERAYLKTLGASCNTSVAALAIIVNDELTLKAEILRPDGSESQKITLTGHVNNAITIGDKAAKELMSRVDANFLCNLFSEKV